MYSKTKYRRALPEDLDEKDSVLAGVDFNVMYLGSALVPTYNGHGSSNTEVVIDRIYTEKYKPFSFTSKIKVAVQISSEKVSVLEVIEREQKEVASFPLDMITFCDGDVKHDKAFAFVIREYNSPSFKAYVFHCETAAKAREMVKLCNEAIVVKNNLRESSRLRALSAPHHTGQSVLSDSAVPSTPKRDERSSQVQSNPRLELKIKKANQDNTRLRSWTEIPKGNVLDRSNRVVHGSNSNQLIDFSLEEDEDEFTALAKKRTMSFTQPIEENTCFLQKSPGKSDGQLSPTEGSLLQL